MKNLSAFDKANSPRVPVQVLAGEYWLHGSVRTQGRRILDLFRESHTCYIYLENTTVRLRRDPERAVAAYQSACLPKEKVSLMILPKRDEQDPLQKFFRISETRSFKGAAILDNCTVQGDVHGIPRLTDSAGTYLPELNNFFPITNARLSTLDHPSIQVPTILINKSYVISFLEGETLQIAEQWAEIHELEDHRPHNRTLSPGNGDEDYRLI